MAWQGVRRKVFVSYYGGDEQAVLGFVAWAERERVLTPRILHDAYNGDFVDSTNTEYVMGVIRRQILDDSSVTLLMMGECTHSRRYIDWELKASLRQGDVYIPNGLLAVSLPGAPAQMHLPERFQENWQQNSGYAKWYRAPQSATELGEWIDDAYRARSQRSHLISNGQDMMRYNRKCKTCGITH